MDGIMPYPADLVLELEQEQVPQPVPPAEIEWVSFRAGDSAMIIAFAQAVPKPA